MSTRREFLLGCSAVSASVGLVPLSLKGSLLAEADLGAISLSTWEDLIRTEFTLDEGIHSGRRLILESVERPRGSLQGIAPTSNDGRGGEWESFSLLFRSVGLEAGLSQNTYAFRHARLGKLQIFIVPVGEPAPQGRLHEAVFNRLLKPGSIHQGARPAIDSKLS